MVICHTEFIPEYRFSKYACAHFCCIISFTIPSHIILIHIRLFRCSVTLALVLEFYHFGRVIAILFNMNHFRHNDIAVLNQQILRNKSIRTNAVVISIFDSLGSRRVRFASTHKSGYVLVFIFLCMINGRQEHPAVNRTAIN